MSAPSPFPARYESECADCGGRIKPGEQALRLPFPAKFDMSYGWQRRTGKMYREVKYSHVKCYEEAEARAAKRASAQQEQEDE